MPLTEQKKYPKLAAALKISGDLYLKREDLHPFGSHKGRSIPLMIESYAKAGWTNFVISSSGNAALAAALAIKKYNLKHKTKPLTLKIFVGKKIDNNKLLSLRGSRVLWRRSNLVEIKQVANPKQQAFLTEKSGLAKNLRQSTDESALIGYQNLARELAKIKNLSAIFIPTSSGTTAEGLYLGFKKQKPQIHIVQTNACHPIVSALRPELSMDNAKTSLASAIVDKVAHRKETVVKIVKASGGTGWIINDKEIKEAIKLVKKYTGLNISPNSALSLAGLKKAIQEGWKFKGAVVCLITGD